MGGLYGDTQADAYAVHGDLAGDWGAGEVAFRISDLKAKTFSYDIDADGGQKASTLVYYTDEGADPVLFQQADGDWRLASDNFRRRRCPRGLERLRAPTLIPWGCGCARRRFGIHTQTLNRASAHTHTSASAYMRKGGTP